MLEIKDKSLLLHIDFSGRGGREKQIKKLFPSLKRHDRKGYDFVSEDAIIYETKKQANMQWFNLAKFHNLSKSEQRIKLLFICVDSNNLVDLIFCVEKGDFLKILVDNKEMRDRGWSWGAIEKAHELVKLASTIQPKTSIIMRNFFKKYRKEVEVIYEK